MLQRWDESEHRHPTLTKLINKQIKGNTMKAYKFRIYPSRQQERQLSHHLWVEKELWNEMLAFTKKFYIDYDKFPTKRTLRSFCKKQQTILPSRAGTCGTSEQSHLAYGGTQEKRKGLWFPTFQVI